ncbi:Rieske (2Fe-2S) protein [Kribbella pittospori]|uniref:Rieske (2Fe-2S) protein n=1 Tax=Kribbella pittospori TaxID=722689 RepID=UPI001EE15268|nr:Rieske (2Fe-2S) protein [Kribbella pittospori]
MDEPKRRTVLAAAAFAAVTGCSTYGEPKSAPASTPQAGTELAKTSQIPVGGGVLFGDKQVVVTQPTAGTFKAFTSVCTHEGCQVASVANGTINCDCHGSKFSIKDGSVVHDPAPQPLAAKQIKVAGDSITLA